MTFWEYLNERGKRLDGNQWGDPRVWITFILIGLFAYAYINRPDNGQMNGALIAAFAAAYGYWIGASKGAAALNENLGKALDVATGSQPERRGDPNAIKEGDKVTLEKER